MSSISFHKVVGSGNDFILIDARRGKAALSAAAFARTWCDRKRGIGADGLLVVVSSRRADARMRIFNPDGSEAEMCGNGLRCVAWFLHAQDHGQKNWTVETGAGLMEARVVSPERVRIFLQPPRNLRLGLPVMHRGRRYGLHAVEIGVPHAVILLKKISGVDLISLGRTVRFHPLFRTKGTNVDLMQVGGASRIAVRTYERGVEAETLACGTGAVACAVIGVALRKLKSPVRVSTQSGEVLTVRIQEGSQGPWEKVSLEGPARILFQGRLAS